MKITVLLTKDCMSREALPCYNKRSCWNGKTPNIDALASKGTIFNKYYAAGGSTAMSMSAMLSGHYPSEFLSRSTYTQVLDSEFPSIFDYYQENDYKCFVLWDRTWISWSDKYVGEFGNSSLVKWIGLDVDQPTDGHGPDVYLKDDEVLKNKTLEEIYKAFSSIEVGDKTFIWIHLPHIIKGHSSYMSDMDSFDTIVGYARQLWGDDNIILSTDHGHMNMHKGIAGYGFDLYEQVVRIPLITPRINGLSECSQLMSNIDLPYILKNKKLPKHRDYVVSDTKYYAQPKRKLAIIGERFKLIYNSKGKVMELYDLDWDPLENYNILKRYHYDSDRHYTVYYDEHFYYPFKATAIEQMKIMEAELKRIWREPSRIQLLKFHIKTYLARQRNRNRKLKK